MSEPNRYETREALAIIALLPEDDAEGARYALATSTDIPAERIDACLAEIGEMFPMLRGHVALATVCLGRAPTIEELLETIPSAVWIDDDKGNIDMNIDVRDEDGGQIASARVHRNYKTGAGSAEFNVSGD